MIRTRADLGEWWRRARHRWLCRSNRAPVHDTQWRLVCPTCRVPTQELDP